MIALGTHKKKGIIDWRLLLNMSIKIAVGPDLKK